MYADEPTLGYVICPLIVSGHRLFCKLIISHDPPGRNECLIISAHPPEFPCPGEKK